MKKKKGKTGKLPREIFIIPNFYYVRPAAAADGGVSIVTVIPQPSLPFVCFISDARSVDTQKQNEKELLYIRYFHSP